MLLLSCDDESPLFETFRGYPLHGKLATAHFKGVVSRFDLELRLVRTADPCISPP